ncbi:MAG: serine--tRNA ligase, partial [Dehalococcoidia bacterium]
SNRNVKVDLKSLLDFDKENRKLIQSKELLEQEKKKISNQKIISFLPNLKKFQLKLMNCH